MIIDSHQHFWKYDPVKHGWINDDMKILQQDYLPENLQKIYQENAVDACVAVQADQSETETDFLMDLAAKNPFIKGVVGWVDLRSENLEERLEYYSQFDILKGFRHVVQDELDPNFIIGKQFKKGIALLHTYGFTYDILIFPKQLEATLQLVKEFPEHRFVIDHIAKPMIKTGFIKEWEVLIREIAKYPNVLCKVSGMVTEADWNHWKYNDFLPYLNVIFESFGTDRIMYGSDWPVCLLGGEYGSIKSIIERYIYSFTDEDKEKIMGKNAVKFYRLDGTK